MASIWTLFGLLRPSSPVKPEPELEADQEPYCDSDTASAPHTGSEADSESEAVVELPRYISSGHDHSSRHGCPRRSMHDLVHLAKQGHLSLTEPCWAELPGHPGVNIYYTLRLLGDPYSFAFYAGMPEDNGVLVACHPDHIVRAIYNNQPRMAGWCAIRLANHGDMPLCQFRDQYMD